MEHAGREDAGALRGVRPARRGRREAARAALRRAPRAARGRGRGPGAAHAGAPTTATARARGSPASPRASWRRRPTRPTCPGERKGMVKIKRVRTLDAVVAAFRFGKEEGTVGSLILGLYDEEGDLHVVGPHVGLQGEARSASCSALLEPYRTGERGSGEAEPLEVGRGARSGRACAPSSCARSASTTSPGNASATARSSCAGATTRTRASATSRSCAARTGHQPRRAGRAGPPRRPRGAQAGTSYLIPPDNPFVGRAGARARDLRVRAAQPLPLLLRPRERRPADRRRGPGRP